MVPALPLGESLKGRGCFRNVASLALDSTVLTCHIIAASTTHTRRLSRVSVRTSLTGLSFCIRRTRLVSRVPTLLRCQEKHARRDRRGLTRQRSRCLFSCTRNDEPVDDMVLHINSGKSMLLSRLWILCDVVFAHV